MTQSGAKHPIRRRDVLRTAVTLGGLTAIASFLKACAQADMRTPTVVPTIRAEPTTTSIPSPSPTTPPEPTPTSSLAPAIPPEPTPTPNPSPTTSPSPAVTSEPSPTASLIPTATEEAGIARVAFVKTRDRTDGVRRALDLLGLNPVQGNKVLLKPNFNSADPAPGSTHNDVLHAFVQEMWEMGAQTITVADRSGMGDTRQVMQQKGIFDLAQELGFETLIFDELEGKEWMMIQSNLRRNQGDYLLWPSHARK
jgi:hypothetical protein